MASKRKNQPVVVDLFAGCGGFSLGLEDAGFDPVFVNELHPDAMGTYLRNRSHTGLASPRNHCFDIFDLTENPDDLDALARRATREHGEVDLVVGGPPCQGYSGIGHRRSFDITKEEIPSNHLYREMAKVITALAPRAFVFENVRGLLTARWTPAGEKGEIWTDVQNTFKAVTVKVRGKTFQYRVDSALVLAKDYGVPQNRPRVLLVGIREDQPITLDVGGIASGLLPKPNATPPDLIDLLSDLADPAWIPGASTPLYFCDPKNVFQTDARRRRDGTVAAKGDLLQEQEYSNHRADVIQKFRYMLDNNGEIPADMVTKKFAQRVLPAQWGPSGPSITATSLPDDYVHYALPRVPTVREWARLQTFPDWYEFSGRRTTGGRRRAGDPSTGDWSRDLPKYTQIGNAVPVALGKAVGNHLRALLAR